MKTALLRSAALALAITAQANVAFAQSSPPLYQGQVPTSQQWQGFFAAKQDYLGAPPMLATGGVFSGRVQFAPSSTIQAGVNLSVGVAPTSPVNGDLWATSAGTIFTYLNGTTDTIAILGGVIPINHCVISNGAGGLVDSGGTCTASGAATNNPNTWTAAQTFTNSDLILKGSSTGTTTFTSANASATSYTLTVPANTGTLAELNLAETWTALQTFTGSDAAILGSSTGYTALASANASTSNFTITFPAITDTLVTLTATQTLTNKSIAGSEINSGTVAGTYLAAINVGIAGNGGVTGVMGISNGGTGTASPGLVGGSGVTITGSWPNQTISTTGGSAPVLLNTLTASNSATLNDTTSLTATYDRYDIVFEGIIPVTNPANCEIQVYANSAYQTSSYNVAGLYGAGSSFSGSFINTTNIPCSDLAIGTAAQYGVWGTVTIYQPSVTAQQKAIVGQLTYLSGHSGTPPASLMLGGEWNNTSFAVTGFQVFFSTGNISTGVIKIYGRN